MGCYDCWVGFMVLEGFQKGFWKRLEPFSGFARVKGLSDTIRSPRNRKCQASSPADPNGSGVSFPWDVCRDFNTSLYGQQQTVVGGSGLKAQDRKFGVWGFQRHGLEHKGLVFFALVLNVSPGHLMWSFGVGFGLGLREVRANTNQTKPRRPHPPPRPPPPPKPFTARNPTTKPNSASIPGFESPAPEKIHLLNLHGSDPLHAKSIPRL